MTEQGDAGHVPHCLLATPEPAVAVLLGTGRAAPPPETTNTVPGGLALSGPPS